MPSKFDNFFSVKKDILLLKYKRDILVVPVVYAKSLWIIYRFSKKKLFNSVELLMPREIVKPNVMG